MDNINAFKNLTVAEKDHLLKILSDNQFNLMIPAVVYIIVLMIFGCVGNSMVFYYYRFKSRITTYSIFICLLAAYDMTVCVFAMPMELTRIIFFYTFKWKTVCRLLRFSNYIASVGSILTLIVIAVDRYRRICKWASVQMSSRLAYISCFVTIAIALLLSWPALILYGSQEIDIPNNYGVQLKGSICTGTWERSYKSYISAFYAYMFALLIICSVVLIVLYSAIGLNVFRHKRRLARHKSANRNNANMSDNSFELCGEPNEVNEASFDAEDNRRLTLILVIITVLFLVSYLPLFAMIIWRQSVGKHQTQFLSGASLAAFDVATTSFLLNSAGNPWVYGILCSDFRHYFMRRVTSVFKK